MCDIETCGYRATGLTLVKENGNIDVLKHNVNATKFFEMEDVKGALLDDFQTMIGHCRFPTKGDEKFPRNNHPFNFGNTTIVHQGILSNDEELKKKYNFTPEGETDSWIIVHLIEKYRNEGHSVIDAIAYAHKELQGNWAVALVDTLEPEKLYLFCHLKSFKVNYFPQEEIFFFSTEDKRLDKFNVEVTNYFEWFEQVKSLQVAELNLKSEECLMLGGEKGVELWDLPEPEFKRFGDGWKKEKNEAEYWRNFMKTDDKKGYTGRHPLKKSEVAII